MRVRSNGLLPLYTAIGTLTLAACGTTPQQANTPSVNAGGTTRVATVYLPHTMGLSTLSYQPVDGFAVTQGDIILGRVDAQGNVIQPSLSAQGLGWSLNKNSLWDGNVIPYVIDSAVPSAGVFQIQAAADHWNKAGAGVSLKPRTTETNYVVFRLGTDTGACSSWVGRIGGAQEILLPPNGLCGTGTLIHEIGHAFGLMHEQSRPDRDDYVTIDYSNVRSDYKRNFDKFNGIILQKYDYNSIMHYGPNSFAIDVQRPTIIPRQAGATIGQRNGLSAGDVKAIRNMYARIPLPQSGCGSLLPGEALKPGEAKTSCRGVATLVYQSDGNLVLYRNSDWRALWASDTYRTSAGQAVMQPDGNLVVYDASGKAVWASGTDRNPQSFLAVQDDGNVVIYNDVAIWATNTMF